MLYKRLELRYDKELSAGWSYYESEFTESWDDDVYKSNVCINLGNVGPYYDVYAPISKVKYWKEKLYQYVQKQLLGEYDELIIKTGKFNNFMSKEGKFKNVLKRSTKNK